MPIEPVAAAAPDTPWKRRIGGLAAVAALGLSALAGCSDDEPPADTGGDGGGVETDTAGDTGGSIPGKETGDTPAEGADDGLNNAPDAEAYNAADAPHEASADPAGDPHKAVTGHPT